MPIEDHHPLYADRQDEWRLCADALRGEQAIKEATTHYLPQPTGFSDNPNPEIGKKLYKAYLERAQFPDLFALTLRGMVGLIHRKEAVVEGLEGTPLESMHENCTRPGRYPAETLMSFHQAITEEICAKGRVAVLADAASKGSDVPWLARYTTESLINWSSDGSFFVLDESGLTRSSNDEFRWIEAKSYRVLRLSGGVYTGQVYADYESLVDEDNALRDGAPAPTTNIVGAPPGASPVGAPGDVTGPRPAEVRRSPTVVRGQGAPGGGFLAGAEPYTPRARGGKPLDYVPLAVSGAVRMSLDPETPPLLSIARSARTIYQLSADYRHQLFNSGQETMYAKGVQAKDVPKVVGSGVIVGLGATGELGFASPSCSGISAHKEAIRDEEARAVAAGVQLFDQGGSGQSGDALRLRYGAQTATLITIARQSAALLEASLRNAARMVNMAQSAIEKIIVKPNLEFLESLMTAQEAQTLVQVWQSGAISYDSLYDNYVRGGIVSGERTADEEQELIDQETPDAPTTGGAAPLGLGEAAGGAAPTGGGRAGRAAPAPSGDGTDAGPDSITDDELLSTFGDYAADVVGEAA